MNRYATLAFIAILVAGVAIYTWAFSQAVAEFSFPAKDGESNLIYRCALLVSPAETEKNAQEAHDFFEPSVVKIAKDQAAAMSKIMVSGKPSSETAQDLAIVQADFEAQLSALQQETKSRFGCSYKAG